MKSHPTTSAVEALKAVRRARAANSRGDRHQALLNIEEALAALEQGAGGADARPDLFDFLTPGVIDAGAQRLVSFEDGSVWPDSWDAGQVAQARTLAERCIRSALGAIEHAMPAPVATLPAPGASWTEEELSRAWKTAMNEFARNTPKISEAKSHRAKAMRAALASLNTAPPAQAHVGGVGAVVWAIRNIQTGNILSWQLFLSEESAGVSAKKRSGSDYQYEAVPLYAAPAHPSGVGAGWKLVPREPTEDMNSRGHDQLAADHADLNDLWRAMYGAAPSQPELHDNHGGYGRCGGLRKVWVDDGEASNFYTGGSCPDCSVQPEAAEIPGREELTTEELTKLADDVDNNRHLNGRQREYLLALLSPSAKES